MTPEERESICEQAAKVAADAPLPTPEQIVILRRLLGINTSTKARHRVEQAPQSDVA